MPDRELSESLHVDHLQRTVLGSVEIYSRDSQIADLAAPVRVERFEPAGSAEAPTAAALEADGAQVVPPRGGKVKKLVGDDACNGMVARINASGATEAVAVEPGHGLLGEQLERLLEHIQRARRHGSCLDRWD